ncbi:GLPGLI family protein [Chryseobacterium sp. X308]|nr:GLPGLI family protein [Chryseobacterium sp. X308]
MEETLKWKILSDRKKIGSYNSQKAVITYGNREWTAWFSNDIPINDGPYIFRGLPGLIVSVADGNDYKFDLVQIKNQLTYLMSEQNQ